MKEEKYEIMGHEIDPSQIENPHIRRSIMKRGGFLFLGHNESERDQQRRKRRERGVDEDYEDYQDYSDMYGGNPQGTEDRTGR